MLKKTNLYVFALMILWGVGCQKNINDPTSDASAYFPLQIGDYWVYQVVQEKYTNSNSATTQSFQVQEKISSSYHQNGQLFFLVEESIRQTNQSAWKLNGIHTVYKNLSEVIIQENNASVIKLTFPITQLTFWNANSYNTNSQLLLQYQDAGRSFSVGKLTFANTVSVVGANDSTLVDQTKYLQVYAQNIGLVYGEDLALAFCQSSPNCVGKGIVESGKKLKWELVASNRLP